MLLTDEIKDKIDEMVKKEKRKGTPDDLIRSSARDMIADYMAKELINDEVGRYLDSII